MKVRTIAGLGMTLLAAGLMTIYFLDPDFPGLSGCSAGGGSSGDVSTEIRDTPGEVADFLADYNATYRALWTDAATAEWAFLTSGGDSARAGRDATRLRLQDFTGGIEILSKLELYRDRVDLDETQDRQIETAWRLAAERPDRMAQQSRRLHEIVAGLQDTLRTHPYPVPLPDGPDRTVAAPLLRGLMAAARDTAARRTLWETNLALGPYLKEGLIETRDLRNELAVGMGYSSHFGLAAADYGLEADELIVLLDQLYDGIAPLYEQLHCWVKHELAQRYGVEPPRRIPVHWLDEPWSASWPGVVEAQDMDRGLRDVQPQWLAEQAERFWMSLGFPSLPLTFWGRSDLLPVDPWSGILKSDRAVTVHVDLAQDVRTSANLRPDLKSFLAAHREIGLAHRALALDRPSTPPVLRRGAGRALDEALAELAELAASRAPYLQHAGVLSAEEAPEPIRQLMSEALHGPVVAVPFLLGTVAHWELDLYENDLPRHQFNTRWWRYADRYQGIAPPAERGEDRCDPAALPLLYQSPGRACDRAVGWIVAHQIHRYICREILEQDPQDALYAGDHGTGRFLLSLMEPGATRDWLQLLRQAIGEEPSSEALVDYYRPLLEWLRTQNEGRETSWKDASSHSETP